MSPEPSKRWGAPSNPIVRERKFSALFSLNPKIWSFLRFIRVHIGLVYHYDLKILRNLGQLKTDKNYFKQVSTKTHWFESNPITLLLGFVGGIMRAKAMKSINNKKNRKPLVKPKAPARTAKKALSKKVADPKTRIADVQQLIVENYDAGKRLAWSFLNKWRVRIEEDEVISITGAALCEAAHRFKPELGVNFRTFLFYYLRGMLLKEITKRVQEQRCRAPMIQTFSEANDDARGVSLEHYMASNTDASGEFSTPEEILEKKELIQLCREATDGLDTLEQKVLERYFGEDESVVDIAKSLGYCRCHISRVKSKALETLTEKLEILRPDADPDQDLITNALNGRKANYRGVRGRRKSFAAVAA